MSTMSAVLEAASLLHLSDQLSTANVDQLGSQLAATGRPAFLKALKELGVEKLSERQKLATAIGKASKGTSSTSTTSVDFRWSSMQLAKELIGDADDNMLHTTLESSLPRIGESPLLPGEPSDHARPDARMRLIMLYGSGHKASDLRAWQAACPPWLEMRVVELPGHGTRAAEGLWSIGTLQPSQFSAPLESIYEAVARERDELVDAIVTSIRPLLGVPYAIYGFSSGAFLAYLVVLSLARSRHPLPFRLFVNGRGAPHCVWDDAMVRLYRSGGEAEMEAALKNGLAVPTVQEQEAADSKARAEAASASDGAVDADASAVDVSEPPPLVPLAERIERKNAFWRAPLLTAAVCVGALPVQPTDGPQFNGESRKKGAEVVATIQHRSVDDAAWKVACPLVAIASTTDRVWPLPMVSRWSEVVREMDAYRYCELPNISHFKALDHELVRAVVVNEMAAAARVATANVL